MEDILTINITDKKVESVTIKRKADGTPLVVADLIISVNLFGESHEVKRSIELDTKDNLYALFLDQSEADAKFKVGNLKK